MQYIIKKIRKSYKPSFERRSRMERLITLLWMIFRNILRKKEAKSLTANRKEEGKMSSLSSDFMKYKGVIGACLIGFAAGGLLFLAIMYFLLNYYFG